MAKSNAQRSKEWKERKKQKGYKQIKIWISPSAQGRLARLKSYYGGTLNDIFDDALKSLEAVKKMGVIKRAK